VAQGEVLSAGSSIQFVARKAVEEGNKVFANLPVDEKAIPNAAVARKLQTRVASQRSGNAGSTVKRALIGRKLS
jgi:hypothetical protein